MDGTALSTDAENWNAGGLSTERLSVLTGAAGAQGTTFGSPYLSLDGSYNARHPSGQTSSVTAASSKENNATKVDDDGNPTHKPELTNDDFGQRQKNPRSRWIHYSQFSLESLDSKEKLMALGSRNFFLCPKGTAAAVASGCSAANMAASSSCSKEADDKAMKKWLPLLKFMDYSLNSYQ